MPSPITPELQNNLAIWRQKAAAGTLSIEEMREAVKLLRAGRVSASYEVKGPKKASKSADELLGELGL